MISIHALREEGDPSGSQGYRRPLEFLSTPSARRATWNSMLGAIQDNIFLSTPSARRATKHLERRLRASKFLSTPSARRATGWSWKHMGTKKFLSTPSARRATAIWRAAGGGLDISIHALREEGDTARERPSRNTTGISIHALREEGDSGGQQARGVTKYFYPRPPRGGRHSTIAPVISKKHFYPRPPRGGRLHHTANQNHRHKISIHALREEGD